MMCLFFVEDTTSLGSQVPSEQDLDNLWLGMDTAPAFSQRALSGPHG
jgi:hypothetical protein